jgi:tetratricopeptide (TPR) repeat protein
MVGLVYVCCVFAIPMPSVEERRMAWQHLIPAKAISEAELLKALAQQNFDIKMYTGEQGSNLDPPLFEKEKRLAELLYNNEKYDDALRAYRKLCTTGNEIFKRELEATGSGPIFGESLAAANLNYAKCLIRAGDPAEASRAAKLGITCSGDSTSSTQNVSMYLRGILALSAHQIKTCKKWWADKYFDTFIELVGRIRSKKPVTLDIGVEPVKFTSEQAEQLGPLLSELGDIYIKRDDPARAERAYKGAQDAWIALGEKGQHNLAAVDQRLAQLYVKTKNYDDATTLIQDALDKSSDSDYLAKSKLLLDKEDALWGARKYYESSLVRCEAMRLWIQKQAMRLWIQEQHK